MEELELIDMSKQGDETALNILFQQNYKKLYGFLIKLTGDIYFSEDLLQETLMKAMINIKSFRGESKFFSWLVAIALNLYKNNLRKQKKIKLNYIDNNLEIPDGNNLEERVYAKIQIEKALKELQTMSLEKRVTFILKHYYGYSLQEIGVLMNCAEGTVKSRLHNTVKALKNVLMEKG